MRLLRSMFGPSRQEVWQELSRQIGAQYVEGGLWKGDKVEAQYGPWVVTLDTYTVSTGKSSVTYTRLRAPYVNRDGFRFQIYRAGFFSDFGKLLGMQDIEIGDPLFDQGFIVKSNVEVQVRALLSDVNIRDLLQRQPAVSFHVADDEGWFGEHFPDGVDELYFQVVGIIKDVDRLKSLFELFAETLQQLCRIGSAYETDPYHPVNYPPQDALLRGSQAPPESIDLLRPATGSAPQDPDRLLRPHEPEPK
jgi:hypothetical protein